MAGGQPALLLVHVVHGTVASTFAHATGGFLYVSRSIRRRCPSPHHADCGLRYYPRPYLHVTASCHVRAHAYPHSNADAHANPCTHSNTDAHAYIYPFANTDSYPDSDSDSYANAYSYSYSYSYSHAYTHTNAYALLQRQDHNSDGGTRRRRHNRRTRSLHVSRITEIHPWEPAH